MKTVVRSFFGGLAALFVLVTALPLTALVPNTEIRLIPTDLALFQEFGYAVAIDGDTAVIGALIDNQAGPGAGAAYVFVRDGSSWVQQAKLIAADATGASQFGNAVAISGGTIVVGAHFNGANGLRAGAAYVFVRNGTTWSQQTRLGPSDPGSEEQFGSAVAIDGNTVAVGALGDSTVFAGTGAVYVFERSGTTWTQQAKLVSNSPQPGNALGHSVSLNGNTIVTGSPFDEDTGLLDSGAVYVFLRTGTAWSQEGELRAGDAAANDHLGWSVSVSGDTLIAGAPDKSAGTGSVYVFTRAAGVWSQQAKLTADDALAGDAFGISVSLDGNAAVVGARFDSSFAEDGGSAYLFQRAGAAWSQETEISSGDITPVDGFGFTVALSGTRVLVGAPFKGDFFEGAAYVFASEGNIAPVANPQSVTTDEDTAATLTLTGSDAEGDTLTFAVLTTPAKGVLSGTAPNLTYTPNLNENGSDSFTFRVNDGALDSAAATVSITITPVNDAPVANAQAVTTLEDTTAGITLTGSDVENAALTFTVLTSPTKGTLSGTAPNLTYTPNLNENGSDSFTFRVNDGALDSAAATVSITITPVNDAPVANAQAVTTLEDTAAGITLTGSDVENDALTFTVLTSPTKGTLSGTAPNLTYTPNSNENGSDSFTFRVNDGALDSAAATVSITITPVNDAPVANAQAVTTLEDTAAGITLTGSDVENGALTFTVLTSPTKGTLSGTAPNLTYTPNSNENGSDSFTFKANDGALDSAAAAVSIIITPVNDVPTADGQSVVTDRDTPVAIQLTGADGDLEVAQTLTFAIVDGPGQGTLSAFDPATGRLLYTPALNYQGPDGFTFTVSDDATAGGPALTSAPATVAIAVIPDNSAPVLSPPVATPSVINENDTVTVSGLLTDADPTDTHLIVIAWGDGAPDTVLELAPGVLAYSATHRYLDDQPTATASDVNTVTVTADDGHGGTASATATVTVNNLPPVVTSVEGPAAPLALGSSATVSVTFGDVGTLDTHIVQISWDDGTADTILSSGGFTRTASHTYAAAGVYTVGITVTDDDTGVATALFQYIVIHDPIGGFVTGGGWIISPPGAYVADPSLSGKATFGFVAKPKSGTTVPSGETQFQLHVAKFKFRSTVYEGLMIAGPTAQFTGSGTVNGSGNYGFIVTATDGQIVGGFGVDEFRIRIWDKATGIVVYDNVLGALDAIGAANPQEIGGGSIVIHKAK